MAEPPFKSWLAWTQSPRFIPWPGIFQLAVHRWEQDRQKRKTTVIHVPFYQYPGSIHLRWSPYFCILNRFSGLLQGTAKYEQLYHVAYSGDKDIFLTAVVLGVFSTCNRHRLLLDTQGTKKTLFLYICRSNYVLPNSHLPLLIGDYYDLTTCKTLSGLLKS